TLDLPLCVRQVGVNIFGPTVEGDNIVFILDRSGSMGEKVTLDGTTKTRAGWVSDSMCQMLPRLKEGANFGIVTFDTALEHMSSTLVTGSDSIDAGMAFSTGPHVAPRNGTNISMGLASVPAYGTVDTVYLLSDGEPTSGITGPSAIASWVKTNLPNTVIHTTNFLGGATANAYLSAIAKASRGTHKNITPQSIEELKVNVFNPELVAERIAAQMPGPDRRAMYESGASAGAGFMGAMGMDGGMMEMAKKAMEEEYANAGLTVNKDKVQDMSAQGAAMGGMAQGMMGGF
ncbi:hypothetical protein ADUPG1_011482, partial [Aduncisulcus paluster]